MHPNPRVETHHFSYSAKMFDIAESISKDIIRENIDGTMKDLVKKGLVESIDSDEPTYKLKIKKR